MTYTGKKLTFCIDKLKSTIFLEIIFAIISPFLSYIGSIFAWFLKMWKCLIFEDFSKFTVGNSLRSLYRNSGLVFHIELYFFSRDLASSHFSSPTSPESGLQTVKRSSRSLAFPRYLMMIVNYNSSNTSPSSK